MSGIAHPLIDACVGDWSVSSTDALRIGLTAARGGLIADAARAGRRVAIVGPAGARLTMPLLAALRGSGGDWFTRDASGGLWSPGRGLTLSSDADLQTWGRREPEVAALRVGEPLPWGVVPAVQVTVTVRLPAERDTRLGRAAELLSAGLGRTAPETWGPVEPATWSWNRDRLTEFARSHMPGEVCIVVSGGGRPLAGLIRVARTPTGLAEQTTMIAPMDTSDGERDFSLAAGLRGVLEELQPIAGVAHEYVSTPDASVPPHFVGPPRPLAFVLGARVAHRAASIVDRLGDVAHVERIGSLKNPGALVTVASEAHRVDLTEARASLDDAMLRRLVGNGEVTRHAS